MHIDTSKGRIANILCQIIVNDQIRGGDIDIIGGLIDHILIDSLPDLRFVDGLGSTPKGI